MRKTIKTMEEFAGLAGVSRPTASKYFEDAEAVTPRSKTKIEAALKKYDYRPNLLASNLMRKETRIIGILIPSLGDPFYAEIVRAIELASLKYGYMALIECSYGMPDMEAKAIDNFISVNVAGICLAPIGRSWSHQKKLARLEQDFPVVLLDTSLEDSSAYVRTNNTQSVGLITEYMVRTASNPVFFPMPNVNINAQERAGAYIEAMDRHGLDPLVLDVQVDKHTWEFEKWGREQMLSVLKKGKFPHTSIICANDRIAFGVLAAAYEAGYKVSRGDGDLSVAGHDNQPLSQFTCPSLTTVAQDVESIGITAVDILLSKLGRLEREGKPDKVLMDAQLVLRQSA